MSKLLPLALFSTVVIFAANAPLAAQGRSTIDPAALDAAVTAPVAGARAIVTNALTSETAVKTAAGMGFTSAQLSARVEALDDATVQQFADQILAGGRANVVISTTAIIIVLLVLILLLN